MQAFSSCGEWELPFVAVCRLLLAVASLVVEHWLWVTRVSVTVVHGLSSCGSRATEHRLNNCGPRAYLPCGTWDLPRSGIKPVSPALAGGFFTTEPPRKPEVFTSILPTVDTGPPSQ